MVSLKNIIQYNTENNIDATNIIGSHCVKFQLFWKNLKKNINHTPFNKPEKSSQNTYILFSTNDFSETQNLIANISAILVDTNIPIAISTVQNRGFTLSENTRVITSDTDQKNDASIQKNIPLII